MTRFRRRRGSGRGRLVMALLLTLIAVMGYYGRRDYNEVTDEVQYVDLSPEQEIALGLQAAPQMAQQHGGLHPDREAQELVDVIGARLVEGTAAGLTPYSFEFHVLADEETVNAFALPGGQVFMTAALLSRLETEGQVAARLTEGLTGAVVVASESYSTAAVLP